MLFVRYLNLSFSLPLYYNFSILSLCIQLNRSPFLCLFVFFSFSLLRLIFLLPLPHCCTKFSSVILTLSLSLSLSLSLYLSPFHLSLSLSLTLSLSLPISSLQAPFLQAIINRTLHSTSLFHRFLHSLKIK